ncbi:MAG: hydantoinase/oxoprolinase family protein [Gammaproteobacteria bacterium]
MPFSKQPGTTMILGVDTGGTFTDFVFYDGQKIIVHKVLSTPDEPEAAIIQGINDLKINHQDLYIVHGSTVATNAVLEKKGVTTAFITNHGFGDMLTIGRQTRNELYNLQPQPASPPVPRELCIETGGRIASDGTVVEPLSKQALSQLRKQIKAISPQAVAINLLFSFIDDRFESEIAAVIPEGIFISKSSAILPEIKEYERGITTWLNACVGPIVEKYIDRLLQKVLTNKVSVMQSSGGTVAATQAGKLAVHMLLSGPAGGLSGAKFVASASGRQRLMTFDMGGTSTDVALIDGDFKLTNEGQIASYPVAIPMVDMHTIGAGGGSIARIDAGGMLQVGPKSAGARPGPACYGNGSKLATVTDANLVLGRLPRDSALAGHMLLDFESANIAIASLADKIDKTIEETAAGIVSIANEHMANALRVISVQRGYNPRDFTLVSFGGAGGLHVCALADALGMNKALVPIHSGVLSALGMLAAPRERQLSRTISCVLDKFSMTDFHKQFKLLEDAGREALLREGVDETAITIQKSVDLRYLGQTFTLNIDWSNSESIIQSFHQAHKRRYGHTLDLAIELVNIRMAIQGPRSSIPLTTSFATNSVPSSFSNVVGIQSPVEIITRSSIQTGKVIGGPAIISENIATTYIPPEWTYQIDSVGNLLLSKK